MCAEEENDGKSTNETRFVNNNVKLKTIGILLDIIENSPKDRHQQQLENTL